MTFAIKKHSSLVLRTVLAFSLAAGLSACTEVPATHPTDIAYDPYEAANRDTHEFNRSLDRAIVRPIGRGYERAVPDGIEDAIGRFAFNLSIPGSVVNNVLQANMKGATEDTYRFVVNSTLGLFGFFDPATDLGMPEARDSDFGQTLHAWGAREGAYIELPLLGPSTERDAVGKVVDLFTNPLTYVLDDPESYFGTAASVSSGLSNRGRYSDTIDSILYESADSYAQAKSLYIQNRRFEIGDGSAGIYADPYDAPYSSALEDPYDE